MDGDINQYFRLCHARARVSLALDRVMTEPVHDRWLFFLTDLSTPCRSVKNKPCVFCLLFAVLLHITNAQMVRTTRKVEHENEERFVATAWATRPGVVGGRRCS